MIAVLTVDIVNSQKLGEEELSALMDWLKRHVNTAPEFFFWERGDSFQVVCEPDKALDLALGLRFLARSLHPLGDVRISIGLGERGPMAPVATSTGEAFVLSGRAFDQLDTARLVLACADDHLQWGLDALAVLCDQLMESLTEKQADVFVKLLEGETQYAIAQTLNQSAPAITQKVKSGQWKRFVWLRQHYKKAFLSHE